jgi:hypothetical protein
MNNDFENFRNKHKKTIYCMIFKIIFIYYFIDFIFVFWPINGFTNALYLSENIWILTFFFAILLYNIIHAIIALIVLYNPRKLLEINWIVKINYLLIVFNLIYILDLLSVMFVDLFKFIYIWLNINIDYHRYQPFEFEKYLNTTIRCL